jgi:hypothetical protein
MGNLLSLAVGTVFLTVVLLTALLVERHFSQVLVSSLRSELATRLKFERHQSCPAKPVLPEEALSSPNGDRSSPLGE